MERRGLGRPGIDRKLHRIMAREPISCRKEPDEPLYHDEVEDTWPTVMGMLKGANGAHRICERGHYSGWEAAEGLDSLLLSRFSLPAESKVTGVIGVRATSTFPTGHWEGWIW